jgi:hypothetical protein
MKGKQSNSQLFFMPAALLGIAAILFLVAHSLSPNSSETMSVSTSAAYPKLTTTESMTSQVTPAPEPVVLSALEQPTPPDPQALNLLLASEINSSTPKGDGYVVTTTFGANWLLSQQQVEELPKSMQIRIDYSRYGAGAYDN